MKTENNIYPNGKKFDTSYPTSKRFKDHSGEMINKIEIIRYVGRRKSYMFYECKCHCGNIFTAMIHNLLTGKTKSCGCLQRIKKVNKKADINIDTNLGKVKLYRIYQYIMAPKSNLVYHGEYGVCAEWSNYKTGFINFYNWAINNGYQDGMNILRKNVQFPYSPDNCIFVDSKISRRFRHSNKLITIDGYTFPLSIWSDITGNSKAMILSRITTCKWSDRDAVLTRYRGTPGVDVIDYTIPPEYEILNGCGH